MPETLITLHTGGALPGIPGDHAPGNYLVDYEARTIRPVLRNYLVDYEARTIRLVPLAGDTSGPTEPLPELASEQPASPVDITSEVAKLEDELKTLTSEQ